MTGSLGQCLSEFRSSASLDELHELATFTRVIPATALGWLEGEPEPKGEVLVRLQHYLYLKGFKLDEFEQLPEPAFKLGQLIALGIVEVPALLTRLDYTAPTALYKVLRGSGLLADRIDELERIIAEHEDERLRLVDGFVSMKRELVLQSPEVAPPSVSPLEIKHADEVLHPSVVAVLLGNTIISLDLLLGSTNDGREYVRATVGSVRINHVIESLMGLLD